MKGASYRKNERMMKARSVVSEDSDSRILVARLARDRSGLGGSVDISAPIQPADPRCGATVPRADSTRRRGRRFPHGALRRRAEARAGGVRRRGQRKVRYLVHSFALHAAIATRSARN